MDGSYSRTGSQSSVGPQKGVRTAEVSPMRMSGLRSSGFFGKTKNTRATTKRMKVYQSILSDQPKNGENTLIRSNSFQKVKAMSWLSSRKRNSSPRDAPVRIPVRVFECSALDAESSSEDDDEGEITVMDLRSHVLEVPSSPDCEYEQWLLGTDSTEKSTSVISELRNSFRSRRGKN